MKLSEAHTKKENKRIRIKKKRSGKHSDIEEALGKLFSVITSCDASVSGPVSKSKNKEFAKKLGYFDFKATDGWLSRWKTRSGIKLKKAHHKKSSADVAGTEQWKSRLPSLLQIF